MRPLPIFFFFFLISALLACRAPTAMSATCNPNELTPCLPAITGPGAPTPACCSKLKEQVQCLCQYEKNPTLRGYINSPNGKKVATACRVPIPKCS